MIQKIKNSCGADGRGVHPFLLFGQVSGGFDSVGRCAYDGQRGERGDHRHYAFMSNLYSGNLTSPSRYPDRPGSWRERQYGRLRRRLALERHSLHQPRSSRFTELCTPLSTAVISVLDCVDAIRAATTDDEEPDLLTNVGWRSLFRPRAGILELIKCFAKPTRTTAKTANRESCLRSTIRATSRCGALRWRTLQVRAR